MNLISNNRIKNVLLSVSLIKKYPSFLEWNNKTVFTVDKNFLGQEQVA